MNNGKDIYEYDDMTELNGDSSIYFAIPAPIIFNKDIGDKRITALSFFSIRRGIDSTLCFSINKIVEWSGRIPNRNKNGINAKMCHSVNMLNNEGYIDIYGDYDGSKYTDCMFMIDKISDECRRYGFAIVYVDEVKKILNFDCGNANDKTMNNDIILLMFAYLRLSIYRRPNKLSSLENGNIENRRAKNPEAYNDFYCDIADNLGISPRVASKSIDILQHMGLIYCEPLPRIKADGKWVTTHTVFCNSYKREGRFLLDCGDGYTRREIDNKKIKLKCAY